MQERRTNEQQRLNLKGCKRAEGGCDHVRVASSTSRDGRGAGRGDGQQPGQVSSPGRWVTSSLIWLLWGSRVGLGNPVTSPMPLRK